MLAKRIIPCLDIKDGTHPAFGEALRTAVSEGVNVCAYDCLVTPDSITIHQPVPVIL